MRVLDSADFLGKAKRTMPERAWQTPPKLFQQHFDEASLMALANGDVPAIHVPDFASKEQCQQLCMAIRQAQVARAAATTSPMTLIGSNFSNSKHLKKSQYFDAVRQSWVDLGAVTELAGYEPLTQIMALLSDIWPARVEVATEPSYGRYFAGGIKTRVSGSDLHFDYVPITETNYSIADVVDQLSWNLYLDVPADCGATTIYNAPVARDEVVPASPTGKWNNKLPSERVAGCEHYTFQPKIGEVVFINTRYPHSIDMSSIADGEWRAQTGSFIGRMPDERLVLWS